MLVRVRVRGPGGQPATVELEAATESDALRQMTAAGAQVLAIDTRRASQGTRTLSSGAFPTLLFSQELLSLLEAGLNLTEAIATLLAKERRPNAQQVIGDILGALREGKNFSNALGLYPACFSDLYLATVRASERTGDLPAALDRYIGYQLQFEAMRKKLVSAAVYPVMLLMIGFLVLLFLLGYVVPKFSAVYETTGRDIPWLSTMLLSTGQLINEHWLWMVVAAVLLIALAIHVVTDATMRRWLIDRILALPFLHEKATEFQLTRFYRALGLLLSSGVPLPKALGMVDGLLGIDQKRRLAMARQSVEEGKSLSVALVANALATPVAESLLRVGESTGRLSDMLERTAGFHDEDFARWLDITSRMLEPLLMTAIGLIIGGVVVLMYIPIFELAGSLQ